MGRVPCAHLPVYVRIPNCMNMPKRRSMYWLCSCCNGVPAPASVPPSPVRAATIGAPTPVGGDGEAPIEHARPPIATSDPATTETNDSAADLVMFSPPLSAPSITPAARRRASTLTRDHLPASFLKTAALPVEDPGCHEVRGVLTRTFIDAAHATPLHSPAEK